MRVALFQAAGTPGDVAANLAAVRRVAHEAAEAGARLVIFPEAFVTGYNIGPELLLALAEPADGAQVRELRTIAAEAGVALLVGYAELEGDDVYNSAVLIERDGQVLLNYRKTHLYGDLDRAAFAAGEALAPVVELDGVKVGVLVCYDIEFPEPARALAERGAQLIAVPTALMDPSGWIAETLVPARAAENQVFVAYCNRVGTEGELEYVGRSSVARPGGGPTEFAPRGEELLLFADVEPEEIVMAKGRHDYLRDRRPDLY